MPPAASWSFRYLACAVPAMTDLSLHDYQILARDFLRNRRRAALFLDMGLGKTAVSLAALEPHHLPALVVAPKRVAETVWDVERDLWRPELSVSLAVGEAAERRLALQSESDIVVLGRDNLKDIDLVFKGKNSLPFRTVIIDELSGYKNRSSFRWKAMRRLVSRAQVEQVWGLTGTPSPNGLLDVWAQIYLLDGGERLGKNITTYKSRYFDPGQRIANGTVVSWDIREGSEEKIHSLLSDICLAMETEGRVKLPGVTQNTIAIEMPKASKIAHEEMKRELAVDLRELFDGKIHTAANAAVLTTKLSQISAGFMYEDPEYVESGFDDGEYVLSNVGSYTVMHHEKTKTVSEIVETVDSPVLVFFRYRVELEMLMEELGSKAHLINEKDVVRKWNDGEIPVLLAHPASAGHGLNLQRGGHHIVWTTLTWDLEEWEQCNKRLNRQGQKHPVVIHSLLTNGSIDHIMRKRLVDKAVTQDALLNYLESPI